MPIVKKILMYNNFKNYFKMSDRISFNKRCTANKCPTFGYPH